jgi:hypothetical protein
MTATYTKSYQILNQSVYKREMEMIVFSIQVQCNLYYPDLVYPEPQLSGLAEDHMKLHHYACAEGVTDDILWVWLQVEP